LQHLAVIMDGNRRWAEQRGWPVPLGHKAGVDAVRTLVRACAAREIPVVTIFAFSTENWRRPRAEVAALMLLLRRFIQQEVSNLVSEGVRLRFLGNRHALAPALQALMASAETHTAGGQRLQLNVALNYGGQWDIVQSVQAWARANPGQSVESLSPQALEPFLCTAGLPPPDLLIRTGGESRISNFMLWQLAYSEFYFTPTLWPDFNGDQLDAAIASFNQRERRFGADVGASQALLSQEPASRAAAGGDK
jgi:undecaprenyl diphosphate synthase